MSQPLKIRILGANQLAMCCDMPSAIEAMRGAFSDLSSGNANVPLRTNLKVTDQTTSLIMPVATEGGSTFGLKAVSLTADNEQRGLPSINACVLLFDSLTGQPCALMDGEFLTALRTGAASGLATDLMAAQDAQHLVVFGAGGQALTQIQAVCCVRAIKKVTVVARNQEKAEKFCNKIGALGKFEKTATTDPSVIADADIVCTTTPSTMDLFPAEKYPEKCHLNAIGSYSKTMREFSPELLPSMSLYVDQRSACLAEAGEIVQGIDSGLFGEEIIDGELGQLVKAQDVSFKPRTLFKSVGNAVQDLAVAQNAFQIATQKDLGQVISL